MLGKLALNSSEAFLELVLVSERENLHRSVMQQLLVVMQVSARGRHAAQGWCRGAMQQQAGAVTKRV